MECCEIPHSNTNTHMKNFCYWNVVSFENVVDGGIMWLCYLWPCWEQQNMGVIWEDIGYTKALNGSWLLLSTQLVWYAL